MSNKLELPKKKKVGQIIWNKGSNILINSNLYLKNARKKKGSKRLKSKGSSLC